MDSIDQLQSGMMAYLPKYGVMKVSGEDAVSFIHGQLSQDMLHLKTDEIRFAGYCTAEGFLFATVFAWKSDQNVYLLLPQTVLPSLLKRLQMYILRAKVTLTDVSHDYAVYGFAGKKPEEILTRMLPDIPQKVFSKKEHNRHTVIRLKDAWNTARFLWISPQKVLPDLPQDLFMGEEQHWELTEIEAGMPEIGILTQNRFLPQALNMDRIDGISFAKGCYPGQEMIAKNQNRKPIPHRMIRASSERLNNVLISEMTALEIPVFEAGNDNPCGILSRVAPREKNGIDCLLIVSHNAIALPSLRLGRPDGPVLHKKALPYSLSDE